MSALVLMVWWTDTAIINAQPNTQTEDGKHVLWQGNMVLWKTYIIHTELFFNTKVNNVF